MNITSNPMIQAEMDYRLERSRQAWGTSRRGRAPRRTGRNPLRRATSSHALG